MMRSRSRQIALAAAFALPLLAGGFFLGARSTRDSARLFDEVMQMVSTRFVDSVPTPDLYEKAELFVVLIALGRPSPLEQPVDLVGVGVSPGSHPVLEAR